MRLGLVVGSIALTGWNNLVFHNVIEGNVDIPLSGVGGVGSYRDVVEYIMAGAHLVQIGAASMSRPDYFPRLLDDLEALLERLGIASLDEIRGCARVEAAPVA